MKNFEGNEFAIQVVANGSYIDDGSGGGKSFVIDTTVIRMNHIALNAWILSETLNCRECYETNEEWEEHKTEYAEKRKTVKRQIIEALGIDQNNGSISITQSQSEIFTIVHISINN